MAVSAVGSQKTIDEMIAQGATATKERNTGELGKDDFLNLLVTQLRYQDPLKPVDDKEFIGQMAQFSALEQMQNMNSSLSHNQAYSLIGKRITASLVDDATKETKAIEGDVTSVKVDGGKAYVVVRGKDVPVDRITNVTDGTRSSQSNISAYMDLIGLKAEGFVYNSESGDLIGVNGTVASIQRGVYEDYAVMNGVDVEIASVITDEASADPDFIRNYLVDNEGKGVTVEIVDRISNTRVPVSAVLRNYSILPDGTIKATLDKLNVPVEGISNVTRSETSGIAAYTNLIGYKAKGSIYDYRYTSTVSVTGVVRSILAGQAGNYAVMDGVTLEVVEVRGDNPSADPEAVMEYLEAQSQTEDRRVSIIVKDGSTGLKVPVDAVLDGYNPTAPEGGIMVKLNGVNVPVDSITGIESST